MPSSKLTAAHKFWLLLSMMWIVYALFSPAFNLPMVRFVVGLTLVVVGLIINVFLLSIVLILVTVTVCIVGWFLLPAAKSRIEKRIEALGTIIGTIERGYRAAVAPTSASSANPNTNP